MTLTVTVTVTLTVTLTATEGAEPHMGYLMDMEVINQIHFEIFNLNKFYIDTTVTTTISTKLYKPSKDYLCKL